MCLQSPSKKLRHAINNNHIYKKNHNLTSNNEMFYIIKINLWLGAFYILISIKIEQCVAVCFPTSLPNMRLHVISSHPKIELRLSKNIFCKI